MATTERWCFTKEQIKNSPSIRVGMDAEKELLYRQQAATLIQDMGQRLSVTQLTINTAIVYMHRFYMFHSFTKYNRHDIAACCLFLAAKVEEQPRKLEHVIKVAHACLHREGPPLDVKSEEYMQQAQDLVTNESILLQTLGFEISVDHPHTHVVKSMHLIRASKDLAQTSYFLATNSLHLTTMCLESKPSVVACACIHLACKWSNWEIPQSADNKYWWEYVDPSVSADKLEELCQEFIRVMEKCPTRLKRKINSNNPLHKPSKKSRADPGTSTVDGEQNGHINMSKAATLSSSFPLYLNDHTDQNQNKEKKDIHASPAAMVMNSLSSASATTGSAALNKHSSSKNRAALPPLEPLTSKYATENNASPNPLSLSTIPVTSPPNVSTKHHHHHHHHHEGPAPKKSKSHSAGNSDTVKAPSASEHLKHSRHGHSSSTSGSKHSHHHHHHHHQSKKVEEDAVKSHHSSKPHPVHPSEGSQHHSVHSHSGKHHSSSSHSSHHSKSHSSHRTGERKHSSSSSKHSSRQQVVPKVKIKMKSSPPPPPPPPLSVGSEVEGLGPPPPPPGVGDSLGVAPPGLQSGTSTLDLTDLYSGSGLLLGGDLFGGQMSHLAGFGATQPQFPLTSAFAPDRLKSVGSYSSPMSGLQQQTLISQQSGFPFQGSHGDQYANPFSRTSFSMSADTNQLQNMSGVAGFPPPLPPIPPPPPPPPPPE